MDSPQSDTTSKANVLFGMPQRTKVLMVMAALVIAAIAVTVNLPKKQTPCELIQGCALRNADMQRMQIALNSAGLNDFEIKGQSIYVPKLRRDVYLKAITDADALPADLCTQQDTGLGNPLLSRDQREQIQLREKKQQIRDMVTRLPFVEQAWFEMDRTKAKSAFHDERQSAVILIQPIGKHLLDSEQINTIRGLITGSIAGMDKNSIVVTDLNAGFAYQESGTALPANKIAAQQVSAQTQVSAEVRDSKNRYENKIREALADLDGVSIEVEVIHHQSKDVVAASPKPKSLSGSPRVMTVGTNSQAAIHTVSTGRTPPPIEPIEPEVQEEVRVKVEIPETLVISKMKTGTHVTVASLRKESAYRARLEEIHSDVTRRIRPTLPAASFSGSQPFPIRFSLARQPDDTVLTGSAGVWASFIKRIGGVWGALAVLAASVFILTFVFSGPARQPLPETNATLDNTVASESEPVVVNSQDQDIRQEISQLIKEDPEAAAQVIKRWIRNAA